MQYEEVNKPSKRKKQKKEDYKVINVYANNDTKLSDIIHSKEFVESLYKLVIKYTDSDEEKEADTSK
jgi:hypothetical protein